VAHTDVVREHHLEGEFELYLQGKVQFDVPVYCVPGNHEVCVVCACAWIASCTNVA
jgi:hypothetical protein